jgi:hypothetical protein
MNNPLFPLVLILIVLLGVWLGIFGPLPVSFWVSLQPWQTLIAATIALLAAGIAWWNTTRILRNTEKLDRQHRAQKQSALRAVLPLALSEVVTYAADSAGLLANLHRNCQNRVLMHGQRHSLTFTQLPGDLITTLAEFIEFSDDLDVSLFKNLLRRIQVQQSRFRSLAADLQRPHGTTSASWIEQIILDTAAIYGGAVAAFDYARQERDELPNDVTWQGVRTALNVMGLWRNNMPTVHTIIDRRERTSSGPK